MFFPSLYEKQMLMKHVHSDCLFGQVMSGYTQTWSVDILKPAWLLSPDKRRRGLCPKTYFEMGI